MTGEQLGDSGGGVHDHHLFRFNRGERQGLAVLDATEASQGGGDLMAPRWSMACSPTGVAATRSISCIVSMSSRPRGSSRARAAGSAHEQDPSGPSCWLTPATSLGGGCPVGEAPATPPMARSRPPRRDDRVGDERADQPLPHLAGARRDPRAPTDTIHAPHRRPTR